jgi:hypothetical protein
VGDCVHESHLPTKKFTAGLDASSGALPCPSHLQLQAASHGATMLALPFVGAAPPSTHAIPRVVALLDQCPNGLKFTMRSRGWPTWQTRCGMRALPVVRGR